MTQHNARRLIPMLAFIGAVGPFSIDTYLPAMPAMAGESVKMKSLACSTR